MIFFDVTSKFHEIEPGLVVHAYNILTTKTWTAILLEKTAWTLQGGTHSSLYYVRPDQSSDGLESVTEFGEYGNYESARLPKELDALPAMTKERSDAVDAWRTEREEFAYRLIVQAFPEFAEGRRSSGHIDIQREPTHCACNDEQIIPQPCPIHGTYPARKR